MKDNQQQKQTRSGWTLLQGDDVNVQYRQPLQASYQSFSRSSKPILRETPRIRDAVYIIVLEYCIYDHWTYL